MKVIVLTEGSRNQGLGHIIRCLALCESFIDMGIDPYIYVNSEDNLKDIFAGFSYEVINWLKDSGYIFKKVSNSDIVIIDSYLAGLDFYKELSSLVKLAVYIDDDKRINYPKGVIVNFAIYADGLYKEKIYKDNRILWGTEYIPLRRVFRESDKDKIRKPDKVKKILLTFGGSDIRVLSPQVLTILKNDKYSGIKKILILGKMASDMGDLSDFTDCNIQIFSNLPSDIVAEAIISADLAISAAGMTLYELAYCQIPTIAIAVTDNQMKGLKEFIKRGFIHKSLKWNEPDLLCKLENLIDFHIDNFSKVKEKAKIGRSIVDGYGGQRIAREIIELIKEEVFAENGKNHIHR